MRVSEGTVEKFGEEAKTRNWVREREQCIKIVWGDDFTWYNEEKKASIRVVYKRLG